MPPTGPLSAGQIDIIKTRIDQGAYWPDDLAGDGPPLPVDPDANALIEALRRGDRAAFTRIVSANRAAGTGRGAAAITPLMAAALYGDAAAVRLLLDAGADPNLKNEAGATALMWAVPDVEKMRLLVDRGADVNARSDDGRQGAHRSGRRRQRKEPERRNGARLRTAARCDVGRQSAGGRGREG